MKTSMFSSVLLSSLIWLVGLSATAVADPVVWNGPWISFTKGDWADWTLPENQDRITDNVWSTRQDSAGLFNIALEDFYQGWDTSPLDTEWAYGTLSDYESLSYTSWASMSGYYPPSMIDQEAVLHLVTDDIYIGIKFTSWTIGLDGGGPGGGGFSYERTTASVPEPSSLLLFAAGLSTTALAAWPRRKQQYSSRLLPHG